MTDPAPSIQASFVPPVLGRVRPIHIAPSGGESLLPVVSSRRTTALWWAAGFAIWTALALLSILQLVVWLRYRGTPVDLQQITLGRLADWYACGVFIPLLVVVTRRWPLDRRHLASRLPLHVALLAGVSMSKLALDVPIQRMLGAPPDTSFAGMVARGGITELIAFGCVAAALHAIEFYRRYRERETLTLQLQARLSDAQLRALRAQLDPHFLFNTLNAATALLHRDPNAADSMLTRLGELLRLTLRSDPEHETPLREEIALLDRYLAIMRSRFSDRVTIRCDVESGVQDALVPSFILQPLVENAFEHGVAPLQRPGLVEIAARAADGALVLTVGDNGAGAAHGGNGNGVGLANTRERLAELYGSAASLRLTTREGGGTVAEVRLPLRLERAAAE